MTNTERNQVLRRSLGWLPGGIPRPCPHHPSQTFSRTYSIEHLHMHSPLSNAKNGHRPTLLPVKPITH
ncbi:uncharacterized protein BX663DRAFT_491077 [Cokeromyces recurvatus]|uniref:uncharacterized protein n=1 Tax=Cokeromyces recurvatus TaxID=90255 RepID=UPI00222052E1|nr:uncharacterized protein BX663DRAFT_491077 [Cokeromyces recurvatus]KAI7907489.1 hypothetical protein BX663DRAFT_491077 [Cokeromyces recurvatus]